MKKKNMKKLITQKASLLFLLTIISSLVLTGCTNKVYYKNIMVYYPTTNYELEEIKINLKSTNKSDLVEELRSILVKKDMNIENDYAGIVKIEKVDLKDDELSVYITGNWTVLNISQRTLIKNGIIKSYANFEFINSVKFYVNELEMEDEYGKKQEAIKIADVENASKSSQATNIIVCNLYFAQNDKLVIEERTFENQSITLLAQAVVDELIKGPTKENYQTAIPKGTKIKKIEVKDEICYLDMNKVFVTKHPGGELQETLTIYSLVNSLTELNGINSVQFLIDGEKVKEYKGNYDFNMPFNRNESILLVEE